MSTTRAALIATLLFALTALDASAQPAPAQETASHDFIMARLAAYEGDFDRALRLIERVIKTDPQNPVLLFERAAMLVDAQKLGRAESELKKLLELHPDFYDANRLLGRLMLDRSNGSPARIEQALQYLRAAYRTNPDDLGTGLTVAQILVSTERFEDAAAILSTLVERAPDHRTANYLYSQVLARLGREDEARVYLERTAAADPTFAPAVFQLLESFQKEREWLRAAQLLQPLVEEDPANGDLQRQQAFFFLRGGKPEDARKILEVLSRADSRDTRSRFLLAEALSDLDRFKEAEAIYRELIEYDPNNVDYLVSFGITQLQNRDFTGAESTFRTILGIEAASEQVRRLATTQLAAIRHERGEYDEALTFALQAVNGGDRLNNQAVNIALDIYRRREQWDAAVSLLNGQIAARGSDAYLEARKLEFLLYAGDVAAIASQVEAVEALENGRQTLAETYAQAKRYEEAVTVLEGLRKDRPEDIPLLFQLGASLERSGRVEESEKVFGEVLRLDADHSPTLNYLGYMWADRGVHLEKAAVMLEKAVEMEPRNGAYLDSLGWVYFRLGKLELAEKYLARSAELVPDDPTIQEHLGDLYSKLGRFEKALGHYRSALGLEPEPEELEGLKVKIAELEKRERPR